jgi:nucleoside-diphosphate-sugar epimerase
MDTAYMHSDEFHFFNVTIHRTMILIIFDDDEASFVWVGTQQEYETTLKKYPSVSPEMYRRIKNCGLNRRAVWPAVIMRIAGVYGEEGNSIPITNQIQRIYEKQISAGLYPANVDHGSTYVHLEDLISAIELSIDKRKDLLEEVVINIGEDETLTYKELQDIISTEIHGKKSKIIHIPTWFAKAGAFMQNLFGKAFIKPWMIDLADDHLEMDSSKAKKLLGWQPKHSLRDTLPKMIKKLKDDPEKFCRMNNLE